MSGHLSKSPPLDDLRRFPGPTPRTLCQASWLGVTLHVKDQDIAGSTTWTLSSKQHIAVVHLSGRINRLETELEGVGALHHPPMNGEAWVIPAEARYASHARGRVVRYAELHLDEHAFPDLSGQQNEAPPIRSLAGHYDDFLFQSVRRLQELVRQQDDLAHMEAEAIARAVWAHFFREYRGKAGPLVRKRHAPRLTPPEKALLDRYVDERMGGAITLSDLASLAGQTVHTFLVSFRQAFGATPAQYVIERRLRRARSLLLASSRDITSIAMETGFASHAHFTSVFRKRVGMTPTEFWSSAR
jgi:AraC family transcriptional regulator